MSAVSLNNSLPLNHYLNEIPEKMANRLYCKAFACSVLAKISWVGYVAIMGAVVVAAYGGMILTGSLPLMLGFGALASIFFHWGLSPFPQ